MRNNLMRLSETYAMQENIEKAKEVLDLSLEKMPIKDFGHYSISLGYPQLYYNIKDRDKARETSATLISIFQQYLTHYSTYEGNDINLIIDNLDTYLYMYKDVLDTAYKYDNDEDYVTKLDKEFVSYLRLFRHLMPDEGTENKPQQQFDTVVKP